MKINSIFHYMTLASVLSWMKMYPSGHRYRIINSVRLEKTCKIIEPNL